MSNLKNTDNFISIAPEMVILNGCTTQSILGGTSYVVFKYGDDIMVAGNQCGFPVNGGRIIVHSTYVRRLARSLVEFRAITVCEIERHAYGAWMDGSK